MQVMAIKSRAELSKWASGITGGGALDVAGGTSEFLTVVAATGSREGLFSSLKSACVWSSREAISPKVARISSRSFGPSPSESDRQSPWSRGDSGGLEQTLASSCVLEEPEEEPQQHRESNAMATMEPTPM